MTGRVALILLVLAGFAPLLTLLLPEALAAPLRAWFDLQCQRDPGRSARLLGHTLPVCTRCLGIYLGLGAGALIGAAAARFRDGPRLSGRRLVAATLVGAAAMLLDVATESLGLRPALAPLRFGTGLALAFPLGAAIGAALER